MTIDWWTLGIQTVNVVILVWLLGAVLLAPGRGDDRAAPRDGAADAGRSGGEAQRGDRGARRDRADTRRLRRRNAKRSSPRPTKPPSRRAPRVSPRRQRRRRRCEAAAKAAIEKEQEAADKAWAERASRLAVEIAEAPRRPPRRPGGARRLPRLAPPGDSDSAGPGAASRGGEWRRAGSDQRDAHSIRPTRSATAALIGEAFGAHPQIAFKVDPALIAGLELHGPHLVVNNSWRADLTKILADLAHDNQS